MMPVAGDGETVLLAFAPNGEAWPPIWVCPAPNCQKLTESIFVHLRLVADVDASRQTHSPEKPDPFAREASDPWPDPSRQTHVWPDPPRAARPATRSAPTAQRGACRRWQPVG